MTRARTPHPHPATLLPRHYRQLLRVARTDLRSRYAGSILGVGWAFMTPILMLSVNALVYSVILKVAPRDLTRVEYVLYIFSGLVPYLMTGEAISQGVGSILSSRAVWANTVFPVDLAPVKAVLLSQVTMVTGVTILLGVAIYAHGLSPSLLVLPVIWLLHAATLIGINWVLSLLNLIVRDLQNVVSLLMMVLLIGTPIAYTREMVPDALRPLVTLNPFAWFVRAYQETIALGELPDASTFAVLVAIAGVTFALGGLFFARVKPVMLDHV
jgi:lipopolysaccharide transport system permease protein